MSWGLLMYVNNMIFAGLQGEGLPHMVSIWEWLIQTSLRRIGCEKVEATGNKHAGFSMMDHYTQINKK